MILCGILLCLALYFLYTSFLGLDCIFRYCLYIVVVFIITFLLGVYIID